MAVWTEWQFEGDEEDVPLFWVKPGSDELTFTLHGELDLDGEATLTKLPIPHFAPGAVIVLDLSELTFVDSSGMRALVLLRRRVNERIGHVLLRKPQANVLRVLRVAGLDQVFHIDCR